MIRQYRKVRNELVRCLRKWRRKVPRDCWARIDWTSDFETRGFKATFSCRTHPSGVVVRESESDHDDFDCTTLTTYASGLYIPYECMERAAFDYEELLRIKTWIGFHGHSLVSSCDGKVEGLQVKPEGTYIQYETIPLGPWEFDNI